MRTTVEALLGVVDPAYAILGLPWYGRAWTTRGPEPFSPTRSGSRYTPASTSWYEDAVAIARANGRNYDPVAQTAWTVYVVKRPGCDTCPETWRQVWYDDVDGFGAKFAFAQEEGMRGVGMWALGYTGAYHGMWNVIGLRTGVIADDVAPTGTAAIAAGASGTQQDLPVVTGDVTLALEAHDTGGSELAFVRIANSGIVDEAGSPVDGSTWPATGSVEWSLEDGPVVVPPRSARRGRPRHRGRRWCPRRRRRRPARVAPGASTAPAGSAAPGASTAPDPGRPRRLRWPGAARACPRCSRRPARSSSSGGTWRATVAPITVGVRVRARGSVMPQPTPSPSPSAATPSGSPRPHRCPSPRSHPSPRSPRGPRSWRRAPSAAEAFSAPSVA
ncbi:MAG: glycosyl hydrolase family 18 protein [Chloroflexota bacterium]